MARGYSAGESRRSNAPKEYSFKGVGEETNRILNEMINKGLRYSRELGGEPFVSKEMLSKFPPERLDKIASFYNYEIRSWEDNADKPIDIVERYQASIDTLDSAIRESA